jgi:DNA-binding transcriptional regulator LsrR (DeoR family)
LYAQGWTLRQIGTELGITATAVSDQLLNTASSAEALAV